MNAFQFMTVGDIKRMLEELSQEELEELLAEKFKNLSPEAKKRVIGLADSGITVVTGSFVSLNSQVAVNIQNTSGFDAEAVFKALAEFHKKNS
jgi:phosphoserine phosphatase